jgi:predicted negative regulator of RcsB-dependent stress response
MQDEAELEALKRWWDENGKGIIAAVVVAVWVPSAGSSIRVSQIPRRRQPQIFTPRCWRIISLKVIPTHWRRWLLQLRDDHASSTYARFGAMLEARIAVDADDMAGAEAALRWA